METVNMLIAVSIIAASWYLLDKALRRAEPIRSRDVPSNGATSKRFGAAVGRLNEAAPASGAPLIANRPGQIVGSSASSLR